MLGRVLRKISLKKSPIWYRDLVLYACPALESFFVRSHNAIRRWITVEYRKQRLPIKGELALAESAVRIF
jgi:hypothetical protein